MADAVDSKSTEGNLVRVQLPPPARKGSSRELNVSEVRKSDEEAGFPASGRVEAYWEPRPLNSLLRHEKAVVGS